MVSNGSQAGSTDLLGSRGRSPHRAHLGVRFGWGFLRQFSVKLRKWLENSFLEWFSPCKGQGIKVKEAPFARKGRGWKVVVVLFAGKGRGLEVAAPVFACKGQGFEFEARGFAGKGGGREVEARVYAL